MWARAMIWMPVMDIVRMINAPGNPSESHRLSSSSVRRPYILTELYPPEQSEPAEATTIMFPPGLQELQQTPSTVSVKFTISSPDDTSQTLNEFRRPEEARY